MRSFIPGVGIAPPKEEGPRYAGFNRRMLAATIDSFVIMLLLAPVIDGLLNAMYGPIALDIPALMQQAQQQADADAARALITAQLKSSGFAARWLTNSLWQWLVLSAATGVCWYFWSATPGKLLLGIRIADADTLAPISEKQIYIRLLGYIPSSLCLCMGFFWISFNKRRQAWHDIWANTVVIVADKKSKSACEAAPRSGSPAPSEAE